MFLCVFQRKQRSQEKPTAVESGRVKFTNICRRRWKLRPQNSNRVVEFFFFNHSPFCQLKISICPAGSDLEIEFARCVSWRARKKRRLFLLQVARNLGLQKRFFLVAFLRRRPSLLSFLEARSDSGIERGEGIWRGAMGRRRRRRNFGGVAARKRGGGEGKRKEFEYSFSPPSIAVCLPPPPALLQIVMEPTHPHGSGGGGGGRTPFSTLSFLRLLRAEERPPTSENGQLRIFALPPWLMRT